MLRISHNFNRFYHALLHDIYIQMQRQNRIIMSFERFKEALKYLNANYPRYTDTGNLVSTKDISDRDLSDHVEFIIAWAGEYGITPQIIEDEWEALKQEAYA